MVYRNDVDALEARYRALEAELAETKRARDAVAQLLAEARARALDGSRLIDLSLRGPARRRRQRSLFAGLAMLLALAGVGIGYRLAADRRADRIAHHALDRYSQLADQVCACRDAACALKISNEIAAWGNELEHERTFPTPPSAAFMERAMAITDRLAPCLVKAMSHESGGAAAVQ
jgi:hypothetical protein